MYVRVDEAPEKHEITGYSYMNCSRIEERVTRPTGGNHGGIVQITDSCGDSATIYRDDIPNLIKALQAAYDHKE